MELSELITRLKTKPGMTIVTSRFLAGLENALKQHGSLSENQFSSLMAIARDYGIAVDLNHGTASYPSLAENPEKKTSSEHRLEEIKGTCGKCDAGIVNATLRSNGAWYAFKCDCDLGNRRLERYPVWKLTHESQYEIDKPCY